MENNFKDTPELDSNRATDGSHVLKQIEKEIKRVEQILLKLEDKSTLLDNENSTAYSRARSCLKKYLNILYQARRLLARSVPLAVAQHYLIRMISLQFVFNKYAELFKNTPVTVEIPTQGSRVLGFLVSSLSSATPVSKEKEQLTEPDYYLKEKAKRLCDSSHIVVPSSTLITCPVFLPPKGNDQDKENSEPTASKNAKLVPRGGLFINKDHARSNKESPPNDASPNGAVSPRRSTGRTNDDITSPLTSPTTADRALQNNQNRTELDEVPSTTPLQDTSSHTLYDSYHSGGHVFSSAPLSQLETETKMTIGRFNDTGELPGSAQQQSSPVVDDPSPHWQSLAPAINPVQESCGQDENKVINTHAASVSREEQFKISSSSQ